MGQQYPLYNNVAEKIYQTIGRKKMILTNKEWNKYCLRSP